MLKKYWCLIVLLVIIVGGGVLFYRWYKYYHYSPIVGHTAAKDSGTRSDDYYACFKQSDSNAVVLRVNASGIAKEGVTLVDLNMMGVIDPYQPITLNTVDPTKLDITSTPLPGGKTEIKIVDRTRHIHLGPGPYMVVASAPTGPAGTKSGEAPKKLFYYYQTYDKDNGFGPDQCAAYRASGNAPSLFIRGYTGYKDLEHCFVQDDPTHPENNKPLYFEAYTDVKIDSKDKIQLTLYDLKNGPVQMTRGSQWDVVDLQDYWFKIKINPDAPPHLGPGPYTATVLATTSAAKGVATASRQWLYPYGTWKESSSPLDCLYSH